MLDMDGTFYLGDRLLDGSLDFLNALERTGRPRFVCNQQFQQIGGPVCGKAQGHGRARAVFERAHFGPGGGALLFAHLSGAEGLPSGNELLRAELERMGLVIDNEHPDYVLIGYDTTLDLTKK